ncbi:MAG: hypothetical protein QOI57_1403 [Rubrobacteraceae bacterium]|jgi:hypothetical protein|nr:hypothetical protein [Rubrobacteraceae bacterium]
MDKTASKLISGYVEELANGVGKASEPVTGPRQSLHGAWEEFKPGSKRPR